MPVVDRALAEAEFVAFDLETTGLLAGSCRIVEVAAVRFRGDGTELDRWERLVNPGCPIPWQAMRVHGITDAMVRDQPGIAHVLPEFLEFVGGEETMLLAHNASFDMGFLSADLERLGLPTPPHAVLDTLAAARRRLPGLFNHRLETIAAHLGMPGGQHRALADSLTVKAAFLHLVTLPPTIGACCDLEHLTRPRFFRERQPPAREPGGDDLLTRAIEQGIRVTIVYDGGTKGATRRPITPKALLRTRGVSYLLAFCHLDAMQKTYRLDRIRAVEPSDC